MTGVQTCALPICQLPPRDALITPWFEVAVDLIGPWNVTISSRVFTFQALTCIDTVTNLAEVIVTFHGPMRSTATSNHGVINASRGGN